MEEEDSEVEEGFSYHRGSQVEIHNSTRWLPSFMPVLQSRRNVQQPVTQVFGSDNAQTEQISRASGGHHSGHEENSTERPNYTNDQGLSPGFANKSVNRTGRGAYTRDVFQYHIGSNMQANRGTYEKDRQYHIECNMQRNYISAPIREEGFTYLNDEAYQNHLSAMGDHEETVTQSSSPPLSELCAGTVALCSLYYTRLKKERRLRDLERRRRVFLFRRSKTRERLRFAVMWAYRLLARNELPSDVPSEEDFGPQESRIWNTIINKAFSPFDWIESFRMTKPTFEFLCDQLRPVVQRMDAAMHRSISVEMQLALTLWHLSSSYDFQTMEKIFGLSCSTICAIVRDLCEAVASLLTPELIAVPQGRTLQETLKGFEYRYGLAQVAGVIGTLHLAVGSPNESMGQFYNTKGWHSVILQAVVDPNFCFWDLNVGCPGSLSDSQVLVASELYERGAEGTLFPNTTKNINRVDVPIHLLGSRSYPLLPWLMTPLTEESSAADVELNRRFTSALTLTQIAFGRLKSRWRCLLKCSDIELSFLPILVTACCTLHNICECRREPFEDHWLEEASEEELEQPSEVEEDDLDTEGAAEVIRTALATSVKN